MRLIEVEPEFSRQENEGGGERGTSRSFFTRTSWSGAVVVVGSKEESLEETTTDERTKGCPSLNALACKKPQLATYLAAHDHIATTRPKRD